MVQYVGLQSQHGPDTVTKSQVEDFVLYYKSVVVHSV